MFCRIKGRINHIGNWGGRSRVPCSVSVSFVRAVAPETCPVVVAAVAAGLGAVFVALGVPIGVLHHAPDYDLSLQL
jgi:hypothetical protein